MRFITSMFSNASCWSRTLLALVLLWCGAVSAGETITYFHNDVAGTPQLATDVNGAVVWRETYRPYGDRLNQSPASVNNKLWFTGKSVDADTGLSYMGARYYDPTIGRFHGVDPAQLDFDELQTINRYAYANNNPYKFVDPDGHSPIDVAFLVYDLGKLGMALSSGTGVGAAAVDVALSVVGVASPIPGTGQALKAARTIERGVEMTKAFDKVGDAAKNSGTFQRVMSTAELKATQETGLLRGGRSGKNFFTNKASSDAKRAQQRLGLDGPLRDVKVEFKIKNDVEVSGPVRAAKGETGTSGGGMEFSTNEATQIEIQRIESLRK